MRPDWGRWWLARARTAWARPAGCGGDAGSAVIEFIALALLLLLPLVYLVITLGRIQAGSLAAQSGARAAARALVTADSGAQGRAWANAAARLALTDQGFQPGAGRLTITCSVQPCLTPGAEVGARLTVQVVLPGVPGFVDALIPLRVTVTARQLQIVDRFRQPGQ